ncbi:MAG TPA: HAMP domain-containing sensor histidine kinase [Dehalococcoidia bacterium]|nr:HAMP domain-containing sensor histidine kinase [Dehalococcoidia bacterium]
MTIRLRIALFAAGVVLVAVALFGLLLYALAAYGARAGQDQALSLRGQQVVTFLSFAPAQELAAARSGPPLDLATSEDTFTEVLSPDGSVLYSNGQLGGATPAVPQDALTAAAARGFAFASVTPGRGVTLRLYVQHYTRPGGLAGGYAVAGQSMRLRNRQLRSLRGLLLISALVTLLAALAACWLLARRALKPIDRLANAADAIGATADLSRRLPPRRTRDEVGRLTASFDRMLARLEAGQDRLKDAYAKLAQALEAQKRFVADASHELRTPLTTIRNNVAFLRQHPQGDPADRAAALDDIAAEGERMSRLVQDLLTLARADAGYHLELTPIDLAPLARDVCRQAQRQQPARTIALAAEPLPASANADAITQLLWIFIDNAIKHTPEGGRISVRLARCGDRAVLAVADEGPGIPQGELPRIFERFVQADPARSTGGAGLGLAIARWIAAEHGGTVSACNNPGAGVTFTAELPAAAGDAVPSLQGSAPA